ncbi:MAG TPA: lanthionine synthetase LanC family protein [Kofleriaceae bacterium]|nr:lanthionine synthetase LanC family protein [Kofleriaceae bacterium]
MSEPVWKPLRVGAAAEEAQRVANEIASWVDALPASKRTGFEGDASAALLLAQCDRATAVQRLEAALVTTLTGPTTISLFAGITGLSWLLPHLADGEGVARALERYDAALLRHLDVPRWEDRTDLLGGLAGVAVMVAERRDPRALQIAERVLFHLETSAIMSDTGAHWRTPARFVPEAQQHLYPDGRIELGVGHGVAGVVGALAQFVAAGIEPVRSRRLLEAGVAWLADMIGGDASRFEMTWPLDVPRLRRIGWCSGHTGVAHVLLRASRALGAAPLEATAVELLRKLAHPTASDGTLDAGFCHGAAGMAHVYNAAYQLTGAADLHRAAVFWLDELLRLRNAAQPPGYRYFGMHAEAPQWSEDVTLLGGAVGTGLVLLAACDQREPEWQRLFLI